MESPKLQGDETAKLAYEQKKRRFHLMSLMAIRKRIVNVTAERQKRWEATEVYYDCFASVKKIPLAVRCKES